jgi:hypothetical protein
MHPTLVPHPIHHGSSTATSEFLSAYHEAVLGWLGASVKVDGKAPSKEAVTDRLALIRHAMDTLFGGRQAFRCCWTYINCIRF